MVTINPAVRQLLEPHGKHDNVPPREPSPQVEKTKKCNEMVRRVCLATRNTVIKNDDRRILDGF